MAHEYGHAGLIRVNNQGKIAPDGYHFMPDGSLMSDIEHERLYGGVNNTFLNSIKFDYSDIPQDGIIKTFNIKGTKGAVFSLEVRNGNNYYYNFTTNRFQAAKSRLSDVELSSGSYQGSITFPEVSSDDQYDIYFWAEKNTRHAKYYESRFEDGSINLNASRGSNSLLVKKVLYQYIDYTLTLSPFSVGIDDAVTGTATSDTITVSANTNSSFIPFEMKYTATSTNVYTISKQPTADDFIAFTTPTLGVPVQLPGENIYPSVSNTDTVDGDFTAGTSTKIVMDTNVANKMVVGDKITIATTDATDTTDGAVTSGDKVVMDNNVVTKMAVGDRITVVGQDSDLGAQLINSGLWTVRALNPDGDNAKEFQASADIVVGDGWTLQFTPKCNRELFTVAALNPDTDNVKEFSYVDKDGGTSSRFGVRDGATLSFSNQMNYRWNSSTIHNLKPGMILVPATNITNGTVIAEYKDVVIDFEDTPQRKRRIKFLEKPVKSKKKPTIAKGRVTDQDGTVIFSKQQKLALTDVAVKTGGFGLDMISFVSGYVVRFRNLKVELNEVTTTTSSSTIGSSSTSVAVAARTGILNDVSIVSGIGIDSSSGLPYVDSGAGATTAGTLVLSAAQELESGITLTFTGSGTIATITGEIQIIKSPPSDFTLRLDIDKILKLN